MARGFFGARRPFSNYHFKPVVYENVTYPTNEHAYQAAKTLDPAQRERIRIAETPAEAKKLGQKVTLRPDWESIKYNVMLDLNRQKYRDEVLAKLLLDTGDEELVEHNWWNDRCWGVCKGSGQNWLGKILMTIRAEIRADLDFIHEKLWGSGGCGGSH